MKLNYVIIGSGPTSIALTLMLCQHKNINITILEASNSIGGCWSVEYLDNKYYSENSPKVMFEYKYFNQILHFLDINPQKSFKNIYGNSFNVMTKFIDFFYTGLNSREILIFITTILKYKLGFFDKNITLHEWLTSNNFSKKGYKTFEILSIAAADKPEKILASVIFGSFSNNALNIKQLKDPKDWINKYTNYLHRKKNVKVLLNHELISIHDNGKLMNNVDYITVNDNNDGNNRKLKKMKFDQYMICIPPLSMKKILLNSTTLVKNNWMSYDKISKWIDRSSYTSFGFQLHFDYNIEFPSNWCWSCNGEWNTIILDISKYSNKYTFDKKIKTVWSCVVIDLDKRSTYINKSVNECNDYNEIIKESLRQIEYDYQKNHKNKVCNLIPYKITSYSGLSKKFDNKGKQHWNSRDSSYTNSTGILIPPKGNLVGNIYWIGSHNIGEITNMETALTSAVDFCNKKMLNTFFKDYKFDNNKILFYIFIIIVIFTIVRITYYLFRNIPKYIVSK